MCSRLACRKQGVRVRRIMQCAWPCITSKGSTGFDPTVKYHAHLMLAHVMATFAINKRLVSLVRCSIHWTRRAKPIRLLCRARRYSAAS